MLHPVIREFVTTTRPFREILAAIPEPREPVVEATLRIHQSLAGPKEPAEAFAAAAALRDFGRDPHLRLFFLASWASLAGLAGRFDEMRAVLRQAEPLLDGAVPPELRVFLMLCEGFRAASLGDVARREGLLRDALVLLPKRSPRRLMVAWELTLVLAQGGRLNDAAAEMSWLAARAGPAFPATRLAYPRFSDAVERGDWAEARRTLRGIARDPDPFRSYETMTRLVESGQALLDLAAPLPGTPPSAAATGPVATMRHLLAGRVDAALETARRAHATHPHGLMGLGFHVWDLVRAELAAGHADAARRLIALRRAAGSRHPLDDLFLFRVERLAGNAGAAARRLRSAIEAAERSRAEGRLDFELRLAIEIPPGELARLARRAGALPPERLPPAPPGPEEPAPDRLVGKSPALRRIGSEIRRLAPIPSAVLVTGETGTGKELVARALHRTGPRRGRPFLAVNCGAIADPLLESELFGHERGAFTGAEKARRGVFEEAEDGTLFLDEVGEMSPRLQAALLRVLENGEIRPVGSHRVRRVRCRVVAATNADLDELVKRGRFRNDLLFRLRRAEIRIPPLRERTADILPLARHFLDLGRPPERRARIAPGLAAHLAELPWPGNARELRNRMERMRLLHSEKADYDLADFTDREAPPGAGPGRGRAGAPEEPAKVLAEGRSAPRRRERLAALFRAHGFLTRVEAARMAGVTPATMTQDLKALVAEGTIEKVMPKRAPRTHFFRVRKNPYVS